MIKRWIGQVKRIFYQKDVNISICDNIVECKKCSPLLYARN